MVILSKSFWNLYPIRSTLRISPATHRKFTAGKRSGSGRYLDLESCLFDSVLVKCGAEKFTWLFNQHHLTTDAWSTALIFQRMANIYGELSSPNSDKGEALNQHFPPYRDYVEYETSFREGAASQKAREFWDKRARTDAEPFTPYGNSSQTETTGTKRHYVDLGLARTEKLRTLVSQPPFRAFTPHLSYFNIFAGLLSIFQHRLGGQKRTSIGTPSHNRPTKAFKETMGLFIELFPSRLISKKGIPLPKSSPKQLGREWTSCASPNPAPAPASIPLTWF